MWPALFLHRGFRLAAFWVLPLLSILRIFGVYPKLGQNAVHAPGDCVCCAGDDLHITAFPAIVGQSAAGILRSSMDIPCPLQASTIAVNITALPPIRCLFRHRTFQNSIGLVSRFSHRRASLNCVAMVLIREPIYRIVECLRIGLFLRVPSAACCHYTRHSILPHRRAFRR